jgi:hypothetical protein
MFSRHTNDVVPFSPLAVQDTTNGQVIALCSAAGKDNFTGRCSEGLGDLLARLFDRFLGFPTKDVTGTARIPVNVT